MPSAVETSTVKRKSSRPTRRREIKANSVSRAGTRLVVSGTQKDPSEKQTPHSASTMVTYWVWFGARAPALGAPRMTLNHHSRGRVGSKTVIRPLVAVSDTQARSTCSRATLNGKGPSGSRAFHSATAGSLVDCSICYTWACRWSYTVTMLNDQQQERFMRLWTEFQQAVANYIHATPAADARKGPIGPTTARPQTNIIADIPSESRLEPIQWGNGLLK